MNRIAIFGGSFNPVHNEHLNIVKAAVRSLSLDKVIVMPSCITPDKDGRITADAEDRLAMCRLAFEGLSGVEVSDYELRRGGVSYSYLTCRAFREKYPDSERYFIIGADMLEHFPRWKCPEEILKCVTLAACARENTQSLEDSRRRFRTRFGIDAATVDYVGAKVSSTRIRALAALGGAFEDDVPENVADYIKERNIYAMPELHPVKNYLKPERWQHTLRVAVMAAQRCPGTGISERTAITAAALHDCAKYLEPNCKELNGFHCPENVPAPVVHQFSGAYVAEHTFGVSDPEILNAIKYHSSGRENMTVLDKLLFLSDMLEEGRHYDGVEELRATFARDIDECLYDALEHQLRYLSSAGEDIYPLTIRAFEYIKEHKNDK